MKFAVKLLLGLIILVALLIGGLATFLTLYFDPNDYRAEIENRARSEAGIDLKIAGDIGWSIYPWLGLELNKISLAYPNKPQLAQLGQASAAVNLPALLSGNIQVDSVLVSDLNLNLVRDPQGADNWSAPAKTTSEPSRESSRDDAKADGQGAMQLAVSKIELQRANIGFNDQQSGQQIRVNSLEFQASDVSTSRSFPISLSAAVQQLQGEKQTLQMDIALSGDLLLDMATLAGQLDRLTLKGAVQAEGLAKPLDFELSTDLKFLSSEPSVALENLALQLDKTRLTGSAGFKAGVANVALAGDRINLDDYLPASEPAASTATGGSTQQSAETGWSKAPLFDPEPLKAVNATVDIGMATALYQGKEVNDIRVQLTARGGKVQITNLAANAFGGAVKAQGMLDASRTPVKLSLTPDLKQIALEQLLVMAMAEPPVQAKVNLGGAVTAEGTSLHSIINSLNGQMTLTAEEGIIQGIDMAQELCQKIENITALGIDPDQVDRTTPIADLKSEYLIKNGVINNPSLTASVDAANLDAKGIIDLPKQSFDYNLGLTIAEDLFKQSCGINPALQGTRIPVNCAGKFDTDPAKLCKLDTRFIGEVIKKAAGKKVQEEIEKKKDEIEQQATEKLNDTLQKELGDKIKGDAGTLLKGLFK